jgi:hypothetical protein
LVQSSNPKKKSSQGELMIWRTKMQARIQGRVQLKDSIRFKWVQISSYKFGPYNPSKVRPTSDEGPGSNLG